MNLTLEQIKTWRRRYHLNQKELAERAGVSQSFIAKIEAGTVEPSYTKAQQIFQALEQSREKQELKAPAVMKTKVIFADVHDRLQDIIKTMKNKGISQVPVLRREKICGIITESTILNKLAEHPEKITSLKAEDVMEDAPPIVPLNTGLKMLLDLLREYPVVLVADKGEIKGIVSKADVLGNVE